MIFHTCTFLFSPSLQHTDRTFHGMDGSVQRADSHVLINTYDYLELKPIADVVPVFKEAKALERSECEGLYCSEPCYIPVRNVLKLVHVQNSKSYVFSRSIIFTHLVSVLIFVYFCEVIQIHLNLFADVHGIFRLQD